MYNIQTEGDVFSPQQMTTFVITFERSQRLDFQNHE